MTQRSHMSIRRRLLPAALPAVITAASAVHSCSFLPPPTAAAVAAILPTCNPATAAAWLVLQRGGSGGHQPPPAALSSTAAAAGAAASELLLPVPAFTTEADILESENGQMWSRLLVESFERVVGRPLLPGLQGMDDRALAQALFEAPRVVVSHQTQADPVLCYGNRRALVLWEMDAPTLTSTPSRLTAEPLERAERQRLLDAVAQNGYIDDYEGVRISSTGQRFMIRQCIVWEMFDAAGVRRGQAATFDDIEPL